MGFVLEDIEVWNTIAGILCQLFYFFLLYEPIKFAVFIIGVYFLSVYFYIQHPIALPVCGVSLHESSSFLEQYGKARARTHTHTHTHSLFSLTSLLLVYVLILL
jgi:hypothetical protein